MKWNKNNNEIIMKMKNNKNNENMNKIMNKWK